MSARSRFAILISLVYALSASAIADKVYVCHRGLVDFASAQTLEIASSALSSHLAHGDFQGRCEDGSPNKPTMTIQKLDDLRFTDTSAGSPAESIQAGNAGSARFVVQGTPNTEYSLSFSNAPVMLQGPGGAPLVVSSFQTVPVATGNLGPSGAQYIYVGAVREATGVSQRPGQYSGVFNLYLQATLGGASAATTAHVFCNIIPSITLAKISDLTFGEAALGEDASLVPPNTTGAARFTIMGSPSRAFSVSLPPDNSVVMVTAGGATPDSSIPVIHFLASDPGGAALGPDGMATLSVGASRGAIRPTQKTGLYRGIFTVTVAYE